MADEVRIHLSTYLKDAGIKASRQQVERLSRDVKRMNRDLQSETDRTAARLGKLPGAFGKIQDALGGFGTTAMSVIGAFKVGWDIGTWLNEKVITPLFGIKDPIEELKKQNRALRREAEEAVKKWNETLAAWSAGWEKEISNTDKARQKIEDLTQAYLKMQAAKERIISAGDDARMLGMERDKFNAMAGASTPEEAAAIGKYHDVLMAEERMKQQIAQHDRRSAEAAEKQAAAEEQLNAMVAKRKQLKKQMEDIDKQLAYLDTQQSVNDLGWKGSIAAEEDARKRKASLEEQIAKTDRDIKMRKSDLAATRESRSAEALERKNIETRAQLEIDEKKKAYDDYVAYVEEQDAARWAEEERQRMDEIRRAAELELKERQALEKQLAAERLDSLRAELREREHAESEAQSRQSAAQGSLSTAWGWYRDQSKMQAVIDEQKAQAMAEVQWEKDFERLKFKRRDWRTADFGSLSAADESVRQVALAKEEKAAADRAVIETAENTRDLADKIDELIAMK